MGKDLSAEYTEVIQICKLVFLQLYAIKKKIYQHNGFYILLKSIISVPKCNTDISYFLLYLTTFELQEQEKKLHLHIAVTTNLGSSCQRCKKQIYNFSAIFQYQFQSVHHIEHSIAQISTFTLDFYCDRVINQNLQNQHISAIFLKVVMYMVFDEPTDLKVLLLQPCSLDSIPNSFRCI